MTQEKQSGITDLIPYPEGILRPIVRLPMIFHQLGLGWLLRPMRLMAITTQGRNSGLARHTILEYRQHGSKLYVVSGWGDKPHWVKNIIKSGAVTIQFDQKELSGNASVVTDSAEALRALYMFQRTGTLYETILANMSNSETIDLKTLKTVADKFTVIRFDLTKTSAPLRGIQPINPALPFVIMGIVLAITTWITWALWLGLGNRNADIDID